MAQDDNKPTFPQPATAVDKGKDEDFQGNAAASGTGPTQAVFVGDDTPGGAGPDDVTAVVSDRSDDDANPKNDPSEDKVNAELAAIDEKAHGDDQVLADRETPVVAQNGVDLFAASETGPNRQGNAYGVSKDALENFKADLVSERERNQARIDAIEREIEELEKQIEDSPKGDKIDTDNANLNILKEAKNEEENKSKGDNHPKTGEGDNNNPDKD